MLFYGGLELIFPIALLGLVILGVIALATGRREADITGSRARALYLCGASFVAVFTVLFAALGCLSSIANLTVASEGEPSECASNPYLPQCQSEFGDFETSGSEGNDHHVSGAVLSGLIAAAAAVVLFLHVRGLRELLATPGPGWVEAHRTFVAYAYTVCFIAMIVVLAAAVAALYGLFRVITPETTATFGSTDAERESGIVQIVMGVFTAVGSALIFLWHWRRIKWTGPDDSGATKAPVVDEP